MTTTAAARRAARLTGVDLARAVAVLGMVAVHVLPQGGLPHDLSSGRAAATFALLAGVGLSLAHRGRPGGEGSVAVRAALIAFVGLAVGTLDTGIAVILVYYGLLFVVALPLLRVGPRPLLVAGAVVAAVVPAVSWAVRDPSDLPIRANPVADTVLSTPGPLLETLLLTGYYPVVAWSAYLLVGLGVGRLALAERSVQVRLAAVGAALAVSASGVSALLLGPLGGRDRLAEDTGLTADAVAELVAGGPFFGNVPVTSPWWLALDTPHSSTTPDLVHTTGVALLVLGLALLLAGALVGRAAWLLEPLVAAGSMPLTLYCLHLLVLDLTDAPATRSYSLQVVGALVLATLWRRLVGRGPLEAALAAAGRAVTPPRPGGR